ncbi:hypothetical protein CRG98_031254 [Punica granatum]|uniref:Uncharacterized protein n=1 Tax=Punica granatum TaxID=22663 RepID=A0A2I0IY53_PUNGR|nr:hypothetical protein CRG98_031254 [Punica granatum]
MSSRGNGHRPGTTSQRSPQGERVTETNVKTHKKQSGPGDTKLRSERPNRAKPVLEAPSRPNIFDLRSPAPRSSRKNDRVPRPLAARTGALHACHYLPRLRRVVPSRSKGSSQPLPSPVKRWSRSEGRQTVHNFLFLRFLSSGLRHVRDLSQTPRSAPKESNEPDLAPCRARSSRVDPFFHRLPRLPTLWSLTRSHLSESCDSHGHFPDSFPRTSGLVLEGSDPRGGDRHGLEEAIDPFGLLGSMTLSFSRIKPSLGE